MMDYSYYDKLSTAELIRLALATADEDARVKCVGTLWRRDTDEMLDHVWPLCERENIEERKLGVEILGESIAAHRLAPDRTAEIIRRALEREDNADMLATAASAANFQEGPGLLEALLRHKRHTDAAVRQAVIIGLTGRTEEEAIAALIELTRDPDTDVRDWATFGLGTQVDEIDSTEIREALFERTEDTDEETRGEALVGLAKRGDPRVIAPLLRELAAQGDEVKQLAFDALVEIGQRIGDPLIYQQLRRLADYTGSEIEEEKWAIAWRFQQQALGFPGEE